MSIFDVSEDVKQEEERDVIGGMVFDTDMYETKIKMAYLDQSKGGAHCLNLVCAIGDAFYNETIYFTNRKGENFYKDKKTGDKRMMPGFNQINNMCLLLAGKKFGAMAMEEKQIKIYDFDEKKEVTKPRKVLSDLTGMIAYPALQKITENKQVKGADDKYVNCPKGTTRDRNEITKWFDSEKRTLPEKKADKDAKFFNDWLKANKGKTKDKVEKVIGAPIAGEETTEDLFGED